MRRRLLALAALAAVGAALGAAFIYSGVYNVSATEQHLAPTYHVLDIAMRRAVKVRASGIAVPALGDPALIARGQAQYARHCVQCHGAPGVAPEPFALGLTPLAANLVQAGAEWPANEIFWVVKHGLKMTGMPAWEFRMGEADLWAVVAFVKTLPRLSPEAYRRMAAGAGSTSANAVAREAEPIGPPDVARGRVAVQQYACVACHEIPGIVGANAPVGPPLERLAMRGLIAGSLPNTPANLEAFLRDPLAHKPRGAMPDIGITPRDARDMAAFLHTLR